MAASTRLPVVVRRHARRIQLDRPQKACHKAAHVRRTAPLLTALATLKVSVWKVLLTVLATLKVLVLQALVTVTALAMLKALVQKVLVKVLVPTALAKQKLSARMALATV